MTMESTEEVKKQAYHRFNDVMLALSKAFALAAASLEDLTMKAPGGERTTTQRCHQGLVGR